MTFPFFYQEYIDTTTGILELDADASRHIISVLRMKAGDPLHLTDGKGHLFTAEILDPHKKKCSVRITATQFIPAATRPVTIGISLLKNSHRFEWFLEKATEIGVAEIIPLLCHRTERQHFRVDRMKGVLVSALLQSQQVWLPVLQEPVAFDAVPGRLNQSQKFIAHCLETDKRSLAQCLDKTLPSQSLLIGPEGDFTPEEIALALEQGFVPVTLGDTRLRTETAGVVGAALLVI